MPGITQKICHRTFHGNSNTTLPFFPALELSPALHSTCLLLQPHKASLYDLALLQFYLLGNFQKYRNSINESLDAKSLDQKQISPQIVNANLNHCLHLYNNELGDHASLHKFRHTPRLDH